MKKMLFQTMATVAVIFLFSSIVQAKIEWQFLNYIDLDEKPIDIAITKDGGKDIVKIMSNTAGQGTNGLHFLGLTQLAFEILQGGYVF